MRLHEARRDQYRRLAKEQGYKSRAAFKLIEANKKYRFITQGSRVVDFGSAPGGWMQVASEITGPGGIVVGVDLSPVRLKKHDGLVSLQADVNDPGLPTKIAEVLGGLADVILSDLSPQVSGVWEIDQRKQIDLSLRVLELCGILLKPGGKAFCKMFEGEGTPEARDRFRRSFAVLRVVKPAASRSASSELYYYCEGFVKVAPPSGTD